MHPALGHAFPADRYEILGEHAYHVGSSVGREEALNTFQQEQRRLMRQASRLIHLENLGLSPNRRKQLQQIWSQSAGSSDLLIHQLETWCHNAERSGAANVF